MEDINYIKKRIAILEWDLPRIKNNDLSETRIKQIKRLKTKLSDLLNKKEVIQNG